MYLSKLQAQIAFCFMKMGVLDTEIDECIAWAFGPKAWYVPIYPDWVDRWRKLHPEYSVDEKSSFVEWMTVVGYLFSKLKDIKIQEMQKFRSLN